MRSLSILALMLLPAIATAADIKTELILAARRLGEQTNYSWTETRIVENTNSRAYAYIVPLEGRFSLPATIYLTRERVFHFMGRPADPTKMRPYTSELAIVGNRCAVKSQWFRGDVGGFSGDWEAYASPRPPVQMGYYVDLASVPHIEIQQFISAAQDIKFDAGTFLLSFDPDQLLRLRTNRMITHVHANESWARFWISNSLPRQYETRIVETTVFFGGRGAPHGHTNTMTNHFLTKLHSIGTTKIEIPQQALRAMNNATPTRGQSSQ